MRGYAVCEERQRRKIGRGQPFISKYFDQQQEDEDDMDIQEVGPPAPTLANAQTDPTILERQLSDLATLMNNRNDNADARIDDTLEY